MTNEEKAIEQLERISEHLSAIGEKEDYTDIAIQALEREPCEDCISRQEVLDVLKDTWNMFSDANDAMQESIDTIEALTPLTPQPKRRLRLFKIIDNNTGKEPTYDVITEQAKLGDLMTDDIDGFYVNEDGQIIFVDDCGNCTWLDMNRFDIESGEEI